MMRSIIFLTTLISCSMIKLGESFTNPTLNHGTLSIINHNNCQRPISIQASKDNSDFWEAQKKLAESMSESVVDTNGATLQL